MNTVYAAIGRFDVRFRYLIVVAWVVITIVCLRAFPSLGSVVPNTTLSAFLPASAPSIQASNLATPFQNLQYASATIVAVRSTGPLTAADQAAIDRLETLVHAMPYVKTVRDLSVSPDGAARQAVVQAAVPLSGTGTGATLVTLSGLRSGRSMPLLGSLSTSPGCLPLSSIIRALHRQRRAPHRTSPICSSLCC